MYPAEVHRPAHRAAVGPDPQLGGAARPPGVHLILPIRAVDASQRPRLAGPEGREPGDQRARAQRRGDAGRGLVARGPGHVHGGQHEDRDRHHRVTAAGAPARPEQHQHFLEHERGYEQCRDALPRQRCEQGGEDHGDHERAESDQRDALEVVRVAEHVGRDRISEQERPEVPRRDITRDRAEPAERASPLRESPDAWECCTTTTCMSAHAETMTASTMRREDRSRSVSAMNNGVERGGVKTREAGEHEHDRDDWKLDAPEPRGRLRRETGRRVHRGRPARWSRSATRPVRPADRPPAVLRPRARAPALGSRSDGSASAAHATPITNASDIQAVTSGARSTGTWVARLVAMFRNAYT